MPALAAYKDAGTVWQKKIDGNSDMLVASVDPELTRIVAVPDYPIQGQGSGQSFHFSASAAIETLWLRAAAKLDAANELYANHTTGD